MVKSVIVGPVVHGRGFLTGSTSAIIIFIIIIIFVIIIIVIIIIIITMTKFSSLISYQLPWFQP